MCVFFFSHKKLKISVEKKIDTFNIFAQNIDCVYTLDRLGEAVLTSTHNLCFRSKIRKLGLFLQTPSFLYKRGVSGGIHFTGKFF